MDGAVLADVSSLTAPLTSRILSPISDRNDVLDTLRQLGGEDAPSYFISTSWFENWLATLPPETAIRLLVFSDFSGPRFALFTGKTQLRRHRIVSSRAYFLNETGKEEFDDLCINHNHVLCRPNTPVDVHAILAALPADWEEFYLSGIAEDSALLKVGEPYRLRIIRNRRSPYVDLRKVREASDYLELTGASVRAQIRRSYRIYEKLYGPVQLDVASSQAEASVFFDEMIDLHQRRWAREDSPGAFANPYFKSFHQRLIEQRFQAGEIQMLRVRAGSVTIGCFYNFVYDGTISFYQSGLRLEDDNRLKPGLVSHTEIIRYNAATGHRIYDFLAGWSRYKESLSTSSRRLVWAVISKRKWKFLIEEKARDCLQWYRARVGQEQRTE